jgi:hypothetical protein
MKSLCFFMLYSLLGLGFADQALMAQVITPDKQLHLIAGAGISAISYFSFYKVSKNKNASLIFALSAGIMSGIAKEIYDAQGYGQPSVADALATSIGAVVPCVAIKFTIHKKKAKTLPPNIVNR